MNIFSLRKVSTTFGSMMNLNAKKEVQAAKVLNKENGVERVNKSINGNSGITNDDYIINID